MALTWQIVFIIISRDPARYRLLMIPSILEKLSFGLATWVLFATGRVTAQPVVGGTVDLLLALLFLVAFMRTAPGAGASERSP